MSLFHICGHVCVSTYVLPSHFQHNGSLCFFHRWLYPRTTSSLPYFFLLPLCWNWTRPHFQYYHWLMAVPYIMYICAFTQCRVTSQIDILARILWINLQACVLCFSMRSTCYYCQPGPSRKNSIYWCALSSWCIISSRFSPFLSHFGYLGIKYSVWCHILGLP